MGTPHPIQGPRPSGSVAGMKLDEVRALIQGTDPERVAVAGRTYNAASINIAAAREEIEQAIKYLSDRWKGPAATEALNALSKLTKMAEELATKSGQTGKALQKYGEWLLPWYRSHLPKAGFVHDGGDDEYAQKYMARLNTRIIQIYDTMPQTVVVESIGIGGKNTSQEELPKTAERASDPLSGSGAPGGTPPSPFSRPHMGATMPPDGPQPGTGGATANPGTSLPSVGNGTDLASLPTGAGGSAGGVPGFGAPGTSLVPGGAPPGWAPAVPSPGALPFGSVSGPRGVVSEGVGRGFGTSGVNTGRATHSGPGNNLIGAPLAGANQQEGKDRKRSTWLTEDRDPWGPDDEPGPALIDESVVVSDDPAPVADEANYLQLAPECDENEEPGYLGELGEMLDELEAELELDETEPEKGIGSAGDDKEPALAGDLGDLLDHLDDDDADAGEFEAPEG